MLVETILPSSGRNKVRKSYVYYKGEYVIDYGVILDCIMEYAYKIWSQIFLLRFESCVEG